ncbi:MAG: hypothetical protein WCC69_12475 [Pirellulales bacterium]
MIRKFDSSGAVVCWDSQRVLRQNAESAFGAVGKDKFVPAVNHLAALTDAAKAVAADGGLNLPGLPLKYFTLDRSSTGIGVYREIRGTQENEYQFMFSVGVSESGRAVFLKQSPQCPLYLGPDAINKLHDVYRESTRYLTASDLTKAVNGFLAASHGVLLRDNGSVYFLPGEFIEQYETLARELVGPKLHCWQVDLSANDKLLATLHDNVQESLISRMEQRAGEWEELTARGGKARSDGLQSRFDAMVEDARQIEYYEEFLQVRLDALRGALERQQAMIGMAHMELWQAQTV